MSELLSAPATAFPEERVAEQLRVTFEARGVAFSDRRGTAIAQKLRPVDEQFNGHRAEIDRLGVLRARPGPEH